MGSRVELFQFPRELRVHRGGSLALDVLLLVRHDPSRHLRAPLVHQERVVHHRGEHVVGSVRRRGLHLNLSRRAIRLFAPRQLVVGGVHAVGRGAAHPQAGEHVAAADGLLSTHRMDPPLRPERFLRSLVILLLLARRAVVAGLEVRHEHARAAPVRPSQRVLRALPYAHPRYPRPPADVALAGARGIGDAASTPGSLSPRISPVRKVRVPVLLLRGWDEVVGIVLKLPVRRAPAGGIAETHHGVGGVRALREAASGSRIAEGLLVRRLPH
mmetsp:Transcript_954/g.3586  ORF Transcript_954/g.3586 Transcript_954/m.3586 type:complete len:271 (+) Transcript_954:115-927(+)